METGLEARPACTRGQSVMHRDMYTHRFWHVFNFMQVARGRCPLVRLGVLRGCCQPSCHQQSLSRNIWTQKGSTPPNVTRATAGGCWCGHWSRGTSSANRLRYSTSLLTYVPGTDPRAPRRAVPVNEAVTTAFTSRTTRTNTPHATSSIPLTD